MTNKSSEVIDYIETKPWGYDLKPGSYRERPFGVVTSDGFVYPDVLSAFVTGFLNRCDCQSHNDELCLMLEVMSAIANRVFHLEENTNTDFLNEVFDNSEKFKTHYIQYLDSLRLLTHGPHGLGCFLNDRGYSVLKMLIDSCAVPQEVLDQAVENYKKSLLDNLMNLKNQYDSTPGMSSKNIALGIKKAIDLL